VPSTLQAAVLFALLIAPGFLWVRGYARGRARTVAERDLYALAQAVVAGIAWLSVIVVALQGWLHTWGVLPRNDALLEQHKTPVALSLLAIVFLPYALGWAAAAVGQTLASRLERWSSKTIWNGVSGTGLTAAKGRTKLFAAKEIKRSGLVAPPSAWDRAWTRPAARDEGWVTILMEDGSFIRGRYGGGAQIDLSPRPRQVFLVEGYGYDQNGDERAFASGDEGLFLDAANIRAIYFEGI
jgi:hypothetical protein